MELTTLLRWPSPSMGIISGAIAGESEVEDREVQAGGGKRLLDTYGGKFERPAPPAFTGARPDPSGARSAAVPSALPLSSSSHSPRKTRNKQGIMH